MQRIKRGLALLLAVLLLTTALPATALAEESPAEMPEQVEEETTSSPQEDPETWEDPAELEEDGFRAPEEDAEEDVSDLEDVELAALRFVVNGQEVPVEYPSNPMSLLPLEEYTNFRLDLSTFLPEELREVEISYILTNATNGGTIPENSNVAVWAKWSYRDEDGNFFSTRGDYTLVGNGTTIDLYNNCVDYATDTFRLELIVGTADQFDVTNKRYIVTVTTSGWDIFDFESTDEDIPFTSTSGWSRWISGKLDMTYTFYVNSGSSWDGESPFAVTMKFKDGSSFASAENLSVAIYEGYHNTVEEAEAATNITSQIWGDSATGYTQNYAWQGSWIQQPAVTVVITRDGTTAVRPIYLRASKNQNDVSLGSYLYENSSTQVASCANITWEDDTYVYLYEMLSGYSANGEYYASAYYYNGGDDSTVAHAAVGYFKTAAAAKREADIQSALFGSGYQADYSGDGVTFTVVDSNDNLYYLRAKTTDYVEPDPIPSGSTSFTMQYAYQEAESNRYSYYRIPSEHDSYAGSGKYQTVFILNSTATDENSTAMTPVTDENIYPYYSAGSGARVYATTVTNDVPVQSGNPQESGKTAHAFQSGVPIQYTVYSENNENDENYWVTFVTRSEEGPDLFINGVTNAADAHKEEDGTIRREVRLMSIYDYHDILIANVGNAAMSGLYVQLKDAQGVELDDYWTIREGSAASLLPFETTQELLFGQEEGGTATASYGELQNMAKIRLRPVIDPDTGELYNGIISGTLVIGYDDGAGSAEEYTIKLTGVSGQLQIVTEELNEGVKYVPYVTAIMTNFMGTAAETSRLKFEIISGTSETNIALRPTGELYGIPKSFGEWTFTVQVKYDDPSSTLSSAALRMLTAQAEFTLKIYDNEDEYVWRVPGDNDYGYWMLEPMGTETGEYHYVISWYGAREFTSDGPHEEFVNLYIDGELMTDGVHYTHRSGSTIITIFEDTIGQGGEGQHTVAAEFFQDGNSSKVSTMQTTSQNYYVEASALVPPATDNPSVPNPSNPSKPTTPTTPNDTAKPDDTGAATPDDTTDPAPSTPDAPFVDVAEQSWYHDDVMWAYENGLMGGVSETRFAPEEYVSQATIVTVLARLANINLDLYANETDDDIPSGTWFTAAAIWAKRIGLLPDGTAFTGEEPISRDQMAIMLVKFLRSLGMDTMAPEQPMAFADADQMSPDGNAAFQILYQYRIFMGVGNLRMEPNSFTTRAQFAALIHRISNLMEG